MVGNKSQKNMPNFASLDDLVEFFDTHDLGEYFDEMPEAHFEVDIQKRTHLSALDEELAENFDTWINREYISENLKSELKKADILIVPIEGFRAIDIPVFPVKNEELFTYIKNRLPSDFNIDICIEDGDYKELALHSDLVILASFVVTSITLPILVNILSEYIKEKILKANEKRCVKVSLTIVDEKGKSKNLTYEGEAENFGRIINESNFQK